MGLSPRHLTEVGQENRPGPPCLPLVRGTHSPALTEWRPGPGPELSRFDAVGPELEQVYLVQVPFL